MLFGYLFRWRPLSEEDAVNSGASFLRDAIKRVPQFDDVTGRHGVSAPRNLPDNWRIVIFRSRVALGDDEHINPIDGQFPYTVLLRESVENGTIVFAAKRYRITDAAVKTFNAYVVPRLQRRHIRVAELADTMMRGTSKLDYYLTHLAADVPRFGASLRSITLSGDDIARAGFFHSDVKGGTATMAEGFPYSYFTAKQIGLRAPGSKISEFGKFGGTGAIQFVEEGISDLETFLGRVGV
jgi:hypothetical protein